MDRLTPTTLTVRERGPALLVKLDRAETGNAIDDALIRELSDVFATATRSPATTVVVLEGLPDAFCVGADFGGISEAVRGGRAMAFDAEQMFDLFEQMAFGDVMTVAHVEGKANAGGVGFVAASDVVIAGPRATFALSELLFGLIPAVVLPFLIRRVGVQRAHYLAGTTLTIGPDRAAEWGLVDAHGDDSDVLLRRHLQRLGRLSKRGVGRYKAYLREMAPLPAHAKRVALDTNREVFADPENVRAIRRFSEEGIFPWEDA